MLVRKQFLFCFRYLIFGVPCLVSTHGYIACSSVSDSYKTIKCLECSNNKHAKTGHKPVHNQKEQKMTSSTSNNYAKDGGTKGIWLLACSFYHHPLQP